MPKAQQSIVVLGFDFGMRCIGVAVGQSITNTATALEILPAQHGVPNWQNIAKLIETWRAQALIVGIPLQMDGTEQQITHHARQFAEQLQERFNLPVYFADERLSTDAAKRLATLQPSKKSKRLDSVAAKLIVESWLNQR